MVHIDCYIVRGMSKDTEELAIHSSTSIVYWWLNTRFNERPCLRKTRQMYNFGRYTSSHNRDHRYKHTNKSHHTYIHTHAHSLAYMIGMVKVIIIYFSVMIN